MLAVCEAPLKFDIAQRMAKGRKTALRAGASSTSSGKIRPMAPTVVRDGKFRLFFFSREERRIHIHVGHPDGEAKFWLIPDVVLANHTGLSDRQLREAQSVIEVHIKEIHNAWNHHFGS